MLISSSSARVFLRSAVAASSKTALKAAVGSHASSYVAAQAFTPATKRFEQKHSFSSVHEKVEKAWKEGTEGYKVSQTIKGSDVCAKCGLDAIGITKPQTVFRNLSYPEIWEHENASGIGEVCKAEYGECYAVDTGKYTGRSPDDRWLVEHPGSESAKNIGWNKINRPCSPQVFDEVFQMGVDYMNTLDKLYVFDGYCGYGEYRKKVRFVTELAWHHHFVTNMFIRPTDPKELENFKPDFTMINCCNITDPNWEKHKMNSETVIIFDPEQNKGVVTGSLYGGEMKKGIFGMMNYWLPQSTPAAFPMHCSANVNQKTGDVCLFFGLSGTGKTTLSADPERALIGDDEHGWDNEGIFNFEGGCYAKTINLTEKTEPDIYRAIRRNALFENVMINPDGTPDYFDVSKTENGRVNYPIFHIGNHHKPQVAGHPANIVFLSCDAFGVLPPVAELSPEQAMYHFLSGYTAKVAGTERGIVEPVPNFSACFGAAFMTLHPTRYADLLKEKMEKHGTKTWLVNSGWSGGPYGVGERMSIKVTRACINAILDGSINKSEMSVDHIFGFKVPKTLEGVDTKLLTPQLTWSDQEAYTAAEKKLAEMYIKNFKKFEGVSDVDYTKFGPQI